MKIIEQQATVEPFNRQEILEKLERIGRVCYGSDKMIRKGSAGPFVKRLITRGHESVLEHVGLTMEILTDRGIQQELTRHRLASYTAESTRYIRYQELQVIPSPEAEHVDYAGFEDLYRLFLETTTAEHARDVLPLCTAGKLYMTANLRQWRHILRLRYFGTTGRPHPKMRELMQQIWLQLRKGLPEVFEDLEK